MRLEIYPEIKHALTQSEAGKSLVKQLRWLQFRTNESRTTWLRDIGATGQVLSHSDLFYHIAEKFLDYENERFTSEEQKTFLLATSVHDIGEAIINGEGLGDIGAYKKTEADEKKEAKIAYRAIASLNLSDETKNTLLSAYKEVIENEGKLHDAFKALEKTEYVLTAMKVYQNCKRLRAQERPAMNEEMEKALVGRVLVIDLPKVLDVYILKFPKSIGSLFKNAAPLIDEMFAYSLSWLESHDTWRDKPVDHKALAESFKAKWEAFKNAPMN